MKLNWLRLFEAIDKNKMQEYFVEAEQKMIHRGQIFVLCPGCKQWVSEYDYEDFCRDGFHEYSKPVDIHANPLSSRSKG